MSRVILIFGFLLLVLSMTVHASETFVISEGAAGGYYYQVTKDEGTYTWLIEGKDRMQTVIETEGNEKELESFRSAVQNADSHLTTLWIAGMFLFIVSTVTVLLFKNQKHVVIESSPVIILTLCVSIYIVFTASFELNQTLHEAEDIFQLLIK